jgi:hypothetical protein
MTTPIDFRTLPLHVTSIGQCGQYLGRSAYWKLYVIENAFRIIVHSVLSAQIGPHWLSVSISPKKKKKIQDIKSDHAQKQSHNLPGSHDIYYLFLTDLSRIIFNRINLFQIVIPDINQWIIRLESIRIPRNLTGHMNWLNPYDESVIDQTYKDTKVLMRQLSQGKVPLAQGNVSLLIP